MRTSGRSLQTILPLKQSGIVIAIIAVLFAVSFGIVDRYVVRQKMGDLMNLADAKYVHLLDFLDQSKNINANRADSATIRQALADYERASSPAALEKIKAELSKVMVMGKLPGPHAFGRRPIVTNRYDAVMVTDKSGKVVMATKPLDIGRNLAETPLWLIGREKTAIIDPWRDVERKVVFGVVSPIYARPDRKGGILGVFITEVDTGVLTMIMNADLGNMLGGRLFFAGFQYRSLDVYVMDRRGRYISQSRTTKSDTVLKLKGSKLPLSRTLDAKTAGDRRTNVGIMTGAHEAMDIYTDHHGVQVAGASMPVFAQGWTVVIEQKTKDAFAGLIYFERFLVIGGILAALLAGFITWRWSARIARSLATLSAEAVFLAGGDYDVEFKTRPNEYRELASLTGSFNDMRHNLKMNLHAMVDANNRLRAIETASKRTIDDMLEFIRPREVLSEQVSINELVRKAIEVAGIPAHIQVEENLDESCPPLMADPNKIIQAIVNTLVRAIRVMPKTGALTVTTRPNAAEQLVEVSVSDTGPPMKPEDLARLFEPTYTNMTSELGFAFPVLKKFVEQHAGKVWVSSRPGQNTVVTVTLPSLPIEKSRDAA